MADSATRPIEQRLPTLEGVRPIHHAIDCLTGITLDVQRLHRSLVRDGAIDGAASAAFADVEAHLHVLGDLLAAIRDDASR